MKEGHSCYRPRRAGERKKKSVRGCIVGHDLSVLALSVAKAGEQTIAGLNDEKKPRRLGPKRATRIRRLFALDKKDDVKRFVLLYTRKIEKGGKTRFKTPKIQRLVTDVRLRRKRLYKAEKKNRWERTKKATAEYVKLLQTLRKKRLHDAHKERREAAEAKKTETTTTTKAAPVKDTKATTTAGKKDSKTPTQPAKGTTTQQPAKGTTTQQPAKGTTAATGKTTTQTPQTKPAETKKPADTKKTTKK
jgi:small subunit ribosomal protein S6e